MKHLVFLAYARGAGDSEGVVRTLEKAGYAVVVHELRKHWWRFYYPHQLLGSELVEALQRAIGTEAPSGVSLIGHGVGAWAALKQLERASGELAQLTLNQVVLLAPEIRGSVNWKRVAERLLCPTLSFLGSDAPIRFLFADRRDDFATYGTKDTVRSRWFPNTNTREFMSVAFVERHLLPELPDPGTSLNRTESPAFSKETKEPQEPPFHVRLALGNTEFLLGPLGFTLIGFGAGVLASRYVLAFLEGRSTFHVPDSLLYTAYLGMIVAFAELAARYRALPSGLGPGVLAYLALNIGVSIGVLAVLDDLAPPRWTVLPEFVRASVATIAGALLLRSAILELGPSPGVPVGPKFIYQRALDACDRAYDKVQASKLSDAIGALMQGVGYGRVRDALPFRCFALAREVTTDQRRLVQDLVSRIDQSNIPEDLGAVVLGLRLSTIVGQVNFTAAMTSLGDQRQEVQEVKQEVRALGERFESILAEPTLVRYDGVVQAEVQRDGAVAVGEVVRLPSRTEAKLVVRFVPRSAVEVPQEPERRDVIVVPPPPPLRISGDVHIPKGRSEPVVTFDVSIDGEGLVFQKDEHSYSFPVGEASGEMAFAFNTGDVPGEHLVFVEVRQLQRLLQVLPMTIVVTRPAPTLAEAEVP